MLCFILFDHCLYHTLHAQGKQKSSNIPVMRHKYHVIGSAKDVMRCDLMLQLSYSGFPDDDLVDPESSAHSGGLHRQILTWCLEPGSGQPAGETRLSNAE